MRLEVWYNATLSVFSLVIGAAADNWIIRAEKSSSVRSFSLAMLLLLLSFDKVFKGVAPVCKELSCYLLVNPFEKFLV